MKSKKLKLLIAIFATILYVLPMPILAKTSLKIYSIEEAITEQSKNNTKVADIGWKYEIINGNLYKRLYDYTNQKWIGNWILCT